MTILEVDCPICGEVLELTAQDRAELLVGDAIVCNSCRAEMEVTVNRPGKGREPDQFELELLGGLTTCTNCGEEFEVTEQLLAAAPVIESADGLSVSLVDCPHCHAPLELEFEG